MCHLPLKSGSRFCSSCNSRQARYVLPRRKGRRRIRGGRRRSRGGRGTITSLHASVKVANSAVPKMAVLFCLASNIVAVESAFSAAAGRRAVSEEANYEMAADCGLPLTAGKEKLLYMAERRLNWMLFTSMEASSTPARAPDIRSNSARCLAILPAMAYLR